MHAKQSVAEDLDDILEDALQDFDIDVPATAIGKDKRREQAQSKEDVMEKTYQHVTNADTNIAETLEKMAQAAQDIDIGNDAANDSMLNDMIKSFEAMEDKGDFNEIVDGMLEQLLSKDIMHEPISQICEKYPKWLAENESTLSKEDYERYGRQYQICLQIVSLYSIEPNNVSKLSELMQKMQECGNPPTDIVKELAPGLQFSEEGMPIFPNKDGGGLTGFPPELQGETCSVM